MIQPNEHAESRCRLMKGLRRPKPLIFPRGATGYYEGGTDQYAMDPPESGKGGKTDFFRRQAAQAAGVCSGQGCALRVAPGRSGLVSGITQSARTRDRMAWRGVAWGSAAQPHSTTSGQRRAGQGWPAWSPVSRSLATEAAVRRSGSQAVMRSRSGPAARQQTNASSCIAMFSNCR